MKSKSLPAIFIVLSFMHTTSPAHIAPISIPANETLQAGDISVIQWEITIYHGPSMDMWDLAYSTASSTSGFIDIATDIPTLFDSGDPVGITQFFEWTVPNIIESDVWIRVDNGAPWIITSPESFEIVPEPATVLLLGLGGILLSRRKLS